MSKACICKPSKIMVFASSGGGANITKLQEWVQAEFRHGEKEHQDQYEWVRQLSI